MWKQLGKNKKALSSLALILLLLISAIIGGLISYVWVMGYYISLKQKIPGDTVAITHLSFNPQNAFAFNVTLLNPSYSPSNSIEVSEIGYQGQNENTLHPVLSSTPTLPFNLSRGTSQTVTCTGNLTSYVNQKLAVSAFVVGNGSGSTNFMTIPYTQLLIRKIGFNSTIGVRNFTITLQNAPLSATNLNVTTISIDTQAINTTLYAVTPSLPYTLAPNKTVTLSLNYNWSSYASAGGSHLISVLTKEGYAASNYTQVPRLAFSIPQINFNQTDTKHFAVTLKNDVSTNTPLNVSKIDILMDNGTVTDVTPKALNSSTNSIPGNATATFTASWNWTDYRDRSVAVTAYTLQGVKASNATTTPALSIINTTFPDSQHILVKVENSHYSALVANVTKITVTLENGTEKEIQITQPSASPYLVGIGNVTMLSAYWDWQTYLNKTIKVNIYTNDGLVTSYATRTPANLANYTVYLTIPSAPVFST